MTNRLEGKVALITGSGGALFDSEFGLGFGGSSAFRFCQEGATVIVSDINDDTGQQFTEELREKGFNAHYKHLDTTNETEWKKTIDWIEKDFGKLDILVNNAGIAGRNDLFETTEPDWDKVNDINSKGCFLGTKLGGILMRKNNFGSIINIASMFGIIGSKASLPYHASKGAVISMSKAAAIQLAPYKIRVNSVCPGFAATPLNPFFRTESESSIVVGRKEETPLKGFVPADQIAWGIVYLASDESEWVTGTELVIDGGYTAQ
ncbi:MAG: hypothetical protein CL782_02125 [Chloroflexi bacterium]|nr:hypothetical protein [Chloroflexota bacterium]